MQSAYPNEIDCFVFYAVFNNCTVISRYNLSIYPGTSQSVSRNANPTTLSAKEGSHYYHFLNVWYYPAGDRTHDLPQPRRTLYLYTTEAVKMTDKGGYYCSYYCSSWNYVYIESLA